MHKLRGRHGGQDGIKRVREVRRGILLVFRVGGVRAVRRRDLRPAEERHPVHVHELPGRVRVACFERYEQQHVQDLRCRVQVGHGVRELHRVRRRVLFDWGNQRVRSVPRELGVAGEFDVCQVHVQGWVLQEVFDGLRDVHLRAVPRRAVGGRQRDGVHAVPEWDRVCLGGGCVGGDVHDVRDRGVCAGGDCGVRDVPHVVVFGGGQGGVHKLHPRAVRRGWGV